MGATHSVWMRFDSFFCRLLRPLLTAVACVSLPLSAQAGLIRDAEIEATLAAYSAPIFRAADIPPESVRMFIVNDPTINAYVAGGLNIFVHTGLITQAKNAGMLIGVIAHETGHIAGAHLSQLTEKSNRATVGGVLGAVLGAAAVAGGAGQAGAGIIAGSQSMAMRNFLGEIRVNEASADQAMLKYLDANDMSATGALEMFQSLQRLESGGTKRDQFMSDHPLTTDRIAAMRNHINESPIPPHQMPEQFAAMHARMVAKLVAFIEPYEKTMAAYPPRDNSVAARYARTIAEFKHSNLAAALKGIDGLIKDYPKDAFFYDTRGQILFENGKLEGAAVAYAKAAGLMPKSPLILTEYAKTLLAGNKASEVGHAILLLERSKELDDSYDVTWRQLALAYSKQGKMGLSYEALAEEAALHGDWRGVIQHIARARADGTADGALDDLERDAKTQLKKKKDDSPF